MQKRPKAILDSNVILTGVLFPNSFSAKLSELNNQVNFVYTDYIWQEIVNKICESAGANIKAANIFLNLSESYLINLNAKKYTQKKSCQTKLLKDHNDQPIYDAACAHGCDYICTYNLADFPDQAGPPKAIPPHTLLMKFRKYNIYIEYPVLGKEGTLFMIFDIMHPSSLGPILKFQDGTIFGGTKDGQLSLNGPSVKSKSKNHCLPENKIINLFFSYDKNGNFYTKIFFEANGKTREQQLCRGNFTPSPPCEPLLFFSRNHGFYGHVRHISSFPKFRRRNLRKAIKFGCLDAICGSADIKEMIKVLLAYPEYEKARRAFYAHV